LIFLSVMLWGLNYIGLDNPKLMVMDQATLSKASEDWKVRPNLTDYETICREFSWRAIREKLNGLPGERGLNIAYEAVDRHAEGSRAGHIAIRWLGKNGEQASLSYGELKLKTNRFANLLRALKVEKGDRVFVLAGRLPELYITAMGTLKNLSVFCPLFSAFGPEPIYQRIHKGKGKVLVTTKKLYERKVADLLPRLPDLEYVLLIDAGEDLSAQVLSLPQRLEAAEASFEIPPTDPEDPALLHFTSGTTGMPKGAVHVHNAVLTHYMTGKYVLDFHPGDVFWCTADPGWVTGTSYGIISPLVHGITNIVDEAEFDAVRWFEILQKELVNIWYTAPTAIRRLMRLEFKPKEKYDLSRLRLIHSVGEPLNPEAVYWSVEALGMPIHDNWWQTETGGIMISNFPSMEIRPGSMGRPLPGIEAAIAHRSEADGTVSLLETPDTIGDLVLKPGWPSMFRGYLEEEARYRKCFAGGWYFTGDLAKRDEDGYYWFVGRADDIIKTSGHMVGPFEVESTLMEHPAVAEAAVIGIPDPVTGELVKAFVSLNPGWEWSEDLRLELIGFGRKKLGAAVAPKEIAWQKSLPKTRSGKIMRRLLKARELGLPEGDTSTLEEEPLKGS
jgi:acetyl-CoA synthetase